VDDASRPDAGQTTTEEIAIDLDRITAASRPFMENTDQHDDFEVMTGWTPDAVHQDQIDFAWPTPTLIGVRCTLNSTQTTPRLLTFMTQDQYSTTSAPLLQTSYNDILTIPTTNDLSQPDHLFSPPKCQCRESLVTLVQNVNTAIQNKQLDAVFRGMQHVVQGFHDIIHCTQCDITCIDLICIMSEFQQTGAGFEYISTTDLDCAMNMTFGGREVPIHDLKLRAMLVTSLIHQANAVLDAIGEKGQHMLRTLCMPSQIAQTNIGHLEKVIGEFRGVLREIAEATDKAASEPRHAAVMQSS
jgi:hypothetical protein